MKQGVQNVFQRYEKKYLLNERQFELFQTGMNDFMVPDDYPSYTICNIYFDTDDYALIRQSMEKPLYKEKLRIRSYGTVGADDPVFVEIKKKYDGVVYKRRVVLTARQAYEYFFKSRYPTQGGQIMREIDYFVKRCHPIPKAFIAYDRTAYSGVEDGELRVTFDRDIRCRNTALDLSMGDWGSQLLTPGQILMEIKISGAAPLWLTHLLNQNQIFPVSYSKYGEFYKQYLLQNSFRKGAFHCA